MHEKELERTAAAGVFAEFCDSLGNLVAQEVYFDWRAAPLPDVGDILTCAPPRCARHQPRSLSGKVRSRHFDVQRTDDGEPRIWVRLVVDVCSPQRLPRARGQRTGCSLN